jgi:hypothetical protein
VAADIDVVAEAQTRRIDLQGRLRGTPMARERAIEGTKNASFVTDMASPFFCD